MRPPVGTYSSGTGLRRVLKGSHSLTVRWDRLEARISQKQEFGDSWRILNPIIVWWDLLEARIPWEQEFGESWRVFRSLPVRGPQTSADLNPFIHAGLRTASCPSYRSFQSFMIWGNVGPHAAPGSGSHPLLKRRWIKSKALSVFSLGQPPRTHATRFGRVKNRTHNPKMDLFFFISDEIETEFPQNEKAPGRILAPSHYHPSIWSRVARFLNQVVKLRR